MPPPPPFAPSGLSATPGAILGILGIDLAWTDNSSDEDGFKIERCQGTAASCTDLDFAQIAQVGADVTSYSDTDPLLLPLTTYTYRVRAYNAFGDSGYSNTASAVPGP